MTATETETAPFELTAVPVLQVETKGEVITNNVAEFRQFIRLALSGINQNPQTDDEFGQAVTDVQGLKSAEATVKGAKEKALADAEQLQALFAELDETADEIAQARLALEKRIEAQKEKVKGDLITEHLNKYTVDGDLAAKHLLPGLQIAIKGKRTLESMRKALDIEQQTKQGLIDRCRAILDTFHNGHGPDMIMDRRELEMKRPDEVEAELRRRFEAKKAADENARLKEQAEAAKRELAAAKAGAEAPPPATIARVSTTTMQAVAATTATPATGTPADAEWAEFKANCMEVFSALKPVRAALRNPENQARAQRFADALNAAWKEVTA
ncbi:MAG: hypothetical protein QM755_23855 [Luteolibacter sp.]